MHNLSSLHTVNIKQFNMTALVQNTFAIQLSVIKLTFFFYRYFYTSINNVNISIKYLNIYTFNIDVVFLLIALKYCEEN